MVRGTTPTHSFEVELETSLIKEVKIIYTQNDKIVLEKRTADCKIGPGKISTTLTQEDTLKFDCGQFLRVQVRVLMQDGEALATELMPLSLAKCYDNEVLK